MKRRHQHWPDEVIGDRADILELTEKIIPLLEVCLNEGIIRQHYNVIEMFLTSIDEYAHEIVALAKRIRRYAPTRQGRPPKWLELTEDVIALGVDILDCVGEIKEQVRRGKWASVAAALRVCLKLSADIGEHLQLIESEPVPRAFYDASKYPGGYEAVEEKPGRWRNRRD